MTDDHPIHPNNEPLPSEYETLSGEELKKRLQVFIADLLEHDFQKLCNLIYRHDVKEEKFQRALRQGNINKQASEIADLVIEREMQKVETRKAYRKRKEGGKKVGENISKENNKC